MASALVVIHHNDNRIRQIVSCRSAFRESKRVKNKRNKMKNVGRKDYFCDYNLHNIAQWHNCIAKLLYFLHCHGKYVPKYAAVLCYFTQC